MTISAPISTQPFFRLPDGSELKTMLDTINGITGGTQSITVTSGGTAGGLNATGPSRFADIPVGSVAYGSLGTAVSCVAGTVYLAEVYVPRNFTATGIGVLNAGTVGTSLGIVALFNSSGTLIANSALAGAVTAGANAFQQRAFTATKALIGPARYWIGYQADSATDNIRCVAASTYLLWTKSSTGTFGTIPNQTVPTTFTADVGPIAYIY